MSININPKIYMNVKTLGQGVKKPDDTRNYCIYNEARVQTLANEGDDVLPYLKEYLQNTSDKTNENGVLEALCVIDKLADKNPKSLDKMYPYLSKFNDTNSPDIQVMLSGIYRKILVPDAFGPLCKMLHKQITHPNSKYFDPTEETGGAILEYLRSYGAQNAYKAADANNAHFNMPV